MFHIILVTKIRLENLFQLFHFECHENHGLKLEAALACALAFVVSLCVRAATTTTIEYASMPHSTHTEMEIGKFTTKSTQIHYDIMCFHGNDAMAKENEKYTDNETQ